MSDSTLETAMMFSSRECVWVCVGVWVRTVSAVRVCRLVVLSGDDTNLGAAGTMAIGEPPGFTEGAFAGSRGTGALGD